MGRGASDGKDRVRSHSTPYLLTTDALSRDFQQGQTNSPLPHPLTGRLARRNAPLYHASGQSDSLLASCPCQIATIMHHSRNCRLHSASQRDLSTSIGPVCPRASLLCTAMYILGPRPWLLPDPASLPRPQLRSGSLAVLVGTVPWPSVPSRIDSLSNLHRPLGPRPRMQASSPPDALPKGSPSATDLVENKNAQPPQE